MTRFLPWLGLAVLAGCAVAPATSRSELDGKVKPVQVVPAVAMPTRKSVVRQVLPQNVRVVVFEGSTAKRTASGVVIAAEATPRGAYSYVLTNAHVVDPTGLSKPVLTVLVDQNGETVDYQAEPLAIGKVPEMDLALVKVRGVMLKAVALAADDELEPGEDVLVVAAPYGKALSVSGGLISQVEWDRKGNVPRMVKTDAPIGYGASGGGVFSRTTGKLLAIVEGYRTAKVGFAVAEQAYSFDVPMPGETFAAPTAKVRSFLETNGFRHLVDAPSAIPTSASARATP
jgi:S1-C subfamily serine protease